MSSSQKDRLTDKEKELANLYVRKALTFRNYGIGLEVKLPGLGTLTPTPKYKDVVRKLFRLIRKTNSIKKIKVAKKYKAISLPNLKKIVILNNNLSKPIVNKNKKNKSMSTKVPQGKGIDFDTLANGAYAAVCYGVAIEGHIERLNFKKEPTKKLYLRIFFDIPEETYSYEKDGEEITKTFTVSHEMTFTNSIKGNLFKFLNPWSNGVIDKDKITDFDIATMVGKTALITIETKPGKDDKTYTNIKGITSLPKGMPIPKTAREKFVFDIDEFDVEKFKMLPSWVMKIVAKSDEFSNQKLRIEDYLEDRKDNDTDGTTGSDADSWG